MITINYLSHQRKDFFKYWNLTCYYLNQIKEENKKKIRLNILATKPYDWDSGLEGIEYKVYYFPDIEVNYMQKIHTAVNDSGEYAIKLDDDCFIGSHVWDFIIENIQVLDDENNFIFTPLLSNNIPNTDRFVETFVEDEEVRQKIYDCYLNQAMPNGLFGADYSPLNEYTINSAEWNSKNFFDGVSRLGTYLKGIHPIRVCGEAQVLLNNYLKDNLERIQEKRDYSIKEISEPYYTTSTFAIRTQEWKNLLASPAYDAFDEIQLNMYKHMTGKRFLYVENGFGIHTIYNTLFGNKNPWGIGLENGREYELEFVNDLTDKLAEIIK